MSLDLDLYRREARVASSPLLRLSAIDISPERPRTTIVFIHGFGGQAEQWHYQLRKLSLENRVIALDLRGPQVMLGYWKDTAATCDVLDEDGWLFTGDVAQQDPDGYFRIIARKADMWYPTKPGRPAFPRDIEEVIYEVPQVKEVAVVGIARRPFAFVIARGERPSADSIIAYCKRRLPPPLVPRFVVFVDVFPRTFIGKVLRRELARRYEQHSSTGEA